MKEAHRTTRLNLPEDPYRKIVDVWNTFYPKRPDKAELQQFLAQSRVLDDVHQSNIRTVIFTYNDFKIVHINVGAARYFCATPDDIITTGPQWILNCIDKDQRSKALGNIAPIAQVMMGANADTLRNSFSCYMNLKITCPAGNHHRSLFQIFPVMLSPEGQPLVGMLLIHEVAPFMADDTWWTRYKVGHYVATYLGETNELTEGDILSNRELEILKMLEEGKSSKDIASQLFLSANTVDNHRRNMLKRTGAKDSSALIYLAKLCQLI